MRRRPGFDEDWEDSGNDDEGEFADEGRSGRVAESLRKVLVSGLSAVLMTEEGIRQVVSDLRLPKDAMGYLYQQAERSRREVTRIVGEEVKHFLQTTDMAGLLRKSLSGMRVEVHAQLKFNDDFEIETTVDEARVTSGRVKKPSRSG